MDAIRLFDPGETPPERITVPVVVNAYLEERKREHLLGYYSAKSVERAEYYLGIFANEHNKPVADCNQSDLTKWMIAHQTVWKSYYTRQDACGSVITCFKWAEQEQIIARNPFRRPKFLGKLQKPRPALEPHEYQSIRLIARKSRTRRGRRCRTQIPFRVALAFCWKTGCRTKEMRVAEWDDLDWDKAVIVLWEEGNKTANATGEPRVIPVRRVLPLLRWLYRHRRGGQKKIFVNTLGKPWTCDRFAKEFRRFAELAGVRKEVSAYCCRHGLVCRLLEAGVGDFQIASVVGHKGTKTISTYGKTTRYKADHLNDVIRHDRQRGDR